MRIAEQAMRVGEQSGLKLRLRSEERRIESQHQRLDILCRDVYSALDKNGPHAAINDFLLYEAAVEAHMTIEEETYFPAIHGLRTDLGSELSDLVQDHVAIRMGLKEIKAHLKSNSTSPAMLSLEALGRQFYTHEINEEELFARVSSGPIAQQAD